MKKLIVSIAAVAALVIPSSVAFATPQPDPDTNGDVHSNCHTGSKFRGAGGEDAGPGNPKDTSDDSSCVAAPTPGPGSGPAPGAGPAAAAAGPGAPSRGAAPQAPQAPAAPAQRPAAVAVVTQPRVTG